MSKHVIPTKKVQEIKRLIHMFYSYFKNLSFKDFPIILLSVASILNLNTFFHEAYLYISHPYLLEYREGAYLPLIQQLKTGEQVYQKMASPAYFYVYGIGFPESVYLLNAWFDLDPILAGRLLNCAFVVGTAILLALCLRKEGTPWSIVIGCAALLTHNLMEAYCILANPNASVAFFTALALTIPFLFGFGIFPTLVSIGVAMLGMMFKQHSFLVLPALLFGYFINRKLSVSSFGVSALLLLPLVTFLFTLNWIFPDYFFSTYWIHKSSSINSVDHMLTQLSFVADKDKWLVIVAPVLYIIQLINRTTKVPTLASFPFIKWPGSAEVIGYRGLLFLVHTVVILLFFVFKMGQNLGAGNGVYLYHCAMFSFILFVVPLFKSKESQISIFLLVFVFLSSNLEKVSSHISNNSLEKAMERNAEVMRPLEMDVKQYKRVANTPEMTLFCFNQGLEFINNGITEFYKDIYAYNADKSLDKYKANSVHYEVQLTNRLIAKDFEVVYFNINYPGHSFINKDTLQKYYRLESEFPSAFLPNPIGKFLPK